MYSFHTSNKEFVLNLVDFFTHNSYCTHIEQAIETNNVLTFVFNKYTAKNESKNPSFLERNTEG